MIANSSLMDWPSDLENDKDVLGSLCGGSGAGKYATQSESGPFFGIYFVKFKVVYLFFIQKEEHITDQPRALQQN